MLKLSLSPGEPRLTHLHGAHNMAPMFIDVDPKIRVDEAIQKAGSQAKLGRILGVNRASVNGWLHNGLEFIPPLSAHRLVALRPDLFVTHESTGSCE